MALLLRKDTGGRLLRQSLPWIILVPLALGFVDLLAESAGFTDAETRTGLLIIALILIFSAILLAELCETQPLGYGTPGG